ncbi:Zinc-finger of C2H2 type/Zinc-finger double-stranded RNA-binding [Trypanosoma brucei equiperdum]|uniref:Zinc-finger of C2H2 type/Zinc-finger double-stranded RNA-binding n=1 Tax=Trypanosoma brucei equiperdum TaxID=630700 RepID=A0A3L6L089_9TRYP|nr:Zinc-finger of C2H2 type/Zinc-finger double-stranded RNA-binding [Trypanosoma brucei equiperdum]
MLQAQGSGRTTGAYYCPCCNIYCSDSRTAQQHLAGLSHKKKSGELAADRKRYKDDACLTPADVMALVERKRLELGAFPWSQLRVQEQEKMDVNTH